MTREELKTILPHRDNMLLLDDAGLDGETAVGHYKVRGDEFFLQGHFPGNPIVPGVILLEILAQTSCVLISDEVDKSKTTLYTGLDKVRFRNPVRPGDVIETRCEITRKKHPFYFCQGKVFTDGKLCAEAQFSFAVTGE